MLGYPIAVCVCGCTKQEYVITQPLFAGIEPRHVIRCTRCTRGVSLTGAQYNEQYMIHAWNERTSAKWHKDKPPTTMLERMKRVPSDNSRATWGGGSEDMNDGFDWYPGEFANR